MAEVKLRALGLREVDFGDFDRYLTALTRTAAGLKFCARTRGAAKSRIRRHGSCATRSSFCRTEAVGTR